MENVQDKNNARNLELLEKAREIANQLDGYSLSEAVSILVDVKMFLNKLAVIKVSK